MVALVLAWTELAQLEFLFLDSLRYNKRGIPNLEQRIAESPPLFVSALALAYKRRDDGQVPLDWRFGYNIQIANLQKSARSLLGRIGRIPGAGPDGKIDSEMLLNWVVEARRHYIEQGLVEQGDQSVGELLSRSPAEEGGGWPWHSSLCCRWKESQPDISASDSRMVILTAEA